MGSSPTVLDTVILLGVGVFVVVAIRLYSDLWTSTE